MRRYGNRRYGNETIASVRRQLVGDSREAERLVGKLIRLVRADERAKTIESLNSAKDRAER